MLETTIKMQLFTRTSKSEKKQQCHPIAFQKQSKVILTADREDLTQLPNLAAHNQSKTILGVEEKKKKKTG